MSRIPTSPEHPTAEIQFRVRYCECDPMQVAYHGSYVPWCEMARTELLRQQDAVYRDLEAVGIYFVVARMSMRFRRPARYDDVLTVRVEALRSHGVKVEHIYEVWREQELLATAETTLACVDAAGNLRPVPEAMLQSDA